MEPTGVTSPQQRLADLGVGLFHAAPRVRTPSIDEFAALTVELVASGDPRLVASLPCLFVLHDDLAAAAARRASHALDGADLERLGLAWRLGRAFAIQWEPDVVHLLGRRRRLPALPFEPSALPEPEEDLGERCPAVAREVHANDPAGNPVIDLIDTFRTWLRQTAFERTPAGHA